MGNRGKCQAELQASAKQDTRVADGHRGTESLGLFLSDVLQTQQTSISDIPVRASNNGSTKGLHSQLLNGKGESIPFLLVLFLLTFSLRVEKPTLSTNCLGTPRGPPERRLSQSFDLVDGKFLRGRETLSCRVL